MGQLCGCGRREGGVSGLGTRKVANGLKQRTGREVGERQWGRRAWRDWQARGECKLSLVQFGVKKVGGW